MGAGHSTRGCASDRLEVVRGVFDLGGVGVAASGTHRRRGREASAWGPWRSPRLGARWSVGESSGERCRVVPVAAFRGQSQRRMTYAHIPLEPTRPASDSRAGLTAQR